LDHQEPEYDVILALSLTKWIHLNWGDEGMKRFFRKVYLHLRPGGVFIVEPQPFTSYSKKKNVSVRVVAHV
jgi:7SK snRNA methylphosphate capping enzyme